MTVTDGYVLPISVPVSSRALTGTKTSPPGSGPCWVTTGEHDDLCHGAGVSIEYPSTLAWWTLA